MIQITTVDMKRHNKTIAREQRRQERRKERQKVRLARKHQRSGPPRIEKMLLRHMKRAVKQARRAYRRGYDPVGKRIFSRRMWRTMYFRAYSTTPRQDKSSRRSFSPHH